MKIIEVSGTPKELGRQTGEALREEIHEHLGLYPPPRSEEWEQRLPAFLATHRHAVPSIMEEMDGLAEGARVPREDIWGLNFPPYANSLNRDGCTNIVFSESPDGPVWGKNNDGYEPGKQRPVCARVVRPHKGIPQINFTFCGMISVGDALNEEGLAIGHSSVGSVFQQSDHFVAVRLWAYEALSRCRTTREFVREMTSRPLRGKGYAWVAVDAEGDARSLEAACPLVQVRLPDLDEGIACVNCYSLPQLADADRRTPGGKANAHRRRAFLDEAIPKHARHGITGMMELLRSHDAEAPICRHGDNDSEGSHTEYSMIGLPDQGRALVFHGYPCTGEYTEIAF